MKINCWSKKCLAFVLGTATMGVLNFIATSNAQTPFVKLVMRFGEERVLEDGTRVGVSKGEGDLIIVTLSKNASPLAPSSSSSSSKLKLGTYGVMANELTRVKSSGTMMDIEARVDFNILSIDNEGNVKAEVSRYGNKRQLNGKIDVSGNLQLEGSYVDSSKIRWNFTLKANTQGNKITNGRYLIDGGTVEVKGKFDEAMWEEDFLK